MIGHLFTLLFAASGPPAPVVVAELAAPPGAEIIGAISAEIIGVAYAEPLGHV